MNEEIERNAAAPMLRRMTDLRDYTIGATDGDIGTVEDVYFDDVSWTVRYLVVDTGTWLSGRKVLLSPAALRGLDGVARRVRTELTRRQVEQSPSIDTQKPVSRQHETEVLSYYGHDPYWSGPYRWGPYAYPYPVAGELPPITGALHQDRVTEEIAARERADHDEHLHSARAVAGYGIRASDGELGHVEDFLIDERDWAIRYLIVDPRNWWPGAHVLVSTEWITAIHWNDSTVEVDLTKEAVRGAPPYDPMAGIERDYETLYHRHHGRQGYWERDPEAWRMYPPAA